MLAPALVAEGLVATRGSRCVLAGVDLSVMPGDMVSIEGVSGVGKSTLLHVLAGLLNADFGQVTVQGVPIEQLTVASRARSISIALQTPTLPSELSVIELVRLGRLPYERTASLLGRFWERDRDRMGPRTTSNGESEIIERALVAVGLHGLASRRLGSLSGGEQRRAHLARVLAQETPVLLLDEPTTHLDELTARQLSRELQRRAARGTAIVLVTHDTAWVHRHCRRSVRLEKGNLLSVPLRPNQTWVARTQEHLADPTREDLIHE